MHSSPNGNHYDRPGHHDPQRRQLHSPKSNPQSRQAARTEAAIVERIGGLRGKKTIIAITHRPTFARNCDCIYMLAQGRLRNSGGYSDLLSREPDFLEFCGGTSGALPVDAASSVLRLFALLTIPPVVMIAVRLRSCGQPIPAPESRPKVRPGREQEVLCRGRPAR